MNREDVYTLANVVIAISTFIGVGSAIAYYLKEVIRDGPMYIVLTEMLYSILIITLLIIVERSIKLKNQTTGLETICLGQSLE